MLRGLVVFTLLLCLSTTVTGGVAYYNCTVKQIYQLSHDSTLVASDSEWSKVFINKSFSVSRRTGEIVGDVVPMLLTTSVRIINKGSRNWSFRAVAPLGDKYQLIEIQEFRVGDIKPFVAVSMGGAGIVTGFCK